MKLSTVALPASGTNSITAAVLPGTSGSPAPVLPQPAPAQNASPGLLQVSMEAAQRAAAEINKFLQSSSANVEFTIEGKSDQVIVRVVDSATNQVIRQMPSEEALAISRSLDRMTGLLLKQKA